MAGGKLRSNVVKGCSLFYHYLYVELKNFNIIVFRIAESETTNKKMDDVLIE